MKNKIWKNLERLIIFLLLISFLGCQSGIVYGMNYGGAEFSPRPSPSPSSGGGSSSSGNNNGNTDASSSNESTVSIPSYVGIEGYVKENVESVNSTKIGKENDEARVDSTEVPLRDVTVKYVDNAGREFSTTTDGDGKYQFGIDKLESGEHTYHIEYTYPNTSKEEINSIDNVDAAKIIQQKLKYNGQDYMGGESKKDFNIIKKSGKSAAQVYLVLDCSYSMDTEIEIKENNNTYKITKLEIEKQIAKNIINSLLTGEKNIYIGLVVFTGVCYRRVALTNNVDTLTNALDGEIEFSDKGYTNILGALDKANESFINSDANTSNKYMFLLSDGLPTSDGNKENTLYRVDYSSPDAASLIAENDAKLEKIAQNTKTKLENIENNDKVKVFSVITKQDLEDEKDENMLYNIFKNNKNSEYNRFYDVDNITNVSKEIVKDFEEYVKESIETINHEGYSLNVAGRDKIKDNFETFTYENTNCFQALDMEIKTSNLEEFKEYAKKLFDKTSITITSKECTANLYCNPLPEPNPKVETNEDGEVVHKTYYVQSEVWLTAPDIYLTKLPQYTITPKISVTGLAVVASTGTVIDRQVTTTEEAENLISTIEKDLLYGSTAVVRYTVDVTNTSLYNDTKTVSILFYVPDGFTCDTKSVSAVGIGENNKKQKLNITKITSLTADTIDDSDIKGLLSKKAIKKIREGNGSEQHTSAIAVTVQVKDDSHYVLPTNGSIKININTTKLLGNDEEMSYGADAEILSYSNDSFKRIEYKAKASSSAISQVAVAGNGSTEEKDYTKTSNRGIILLPTGGDKRMLKQRILLVILVSACGIIIYKLKKSEKDKHNK